MPNSISRTGFFDGFFRRTLWLSVLFASLAGSNLVVAQSRPQANRQKQASQEPKSQKSAESAEAEDDKKAEEEPKTVMIGGVKWYVDYDAALKIAQEKDKPMWLHFGENPG